MSLPFVYLGILIGASLRRENMWGPILEKCRIRLSKWKQKTLSSVGRVILINLGLPMGVERKGGEKCHGEVGRLGIKNIFQKNVKCKFAIDVWNACYRWLGLFSAMHKKPIQHFMIHDCSWLGTTVWALWCHRNNLIFGEQSLDLDSVVETIKFKSWLWLESYVKAFHFSFFEWFSNPMSSLQSL
uniref:Reverse transcriptase zinc-binding domain-containing protein n=1 Tax=Glycine max TaxID=3847 RepID=I1LMJ9_SOYBN